MPQTVPFVVSQEQRGSLPLLRVRGDLDIRSAPVLKQAILAALGSEAQSIAIDSSLVAFMDSAGISVLLGAKKRIAERGGQVYVVGLADQARRIFSILRLERIFVLCRELDLPLHSDQAV